tara:strand:- start:1098 stop:3047 length:1950 start_codon:yes stop_codon:yes gene_type:complete
MDIHQNEIDLSIVAAGHTFTSLNQDVSNLNRGYSDYWALKVDSTGVLVYDKIFGGDSTDNLSAIVPTSDDGYLLAGSSASGRNGEKSEDSKGGFDYWVIKINKNGNVEWDKTIGGSQDDFLTCAIGSGDGGFYLGGYSFSNISGNKSQNSFGAEDFWLLKLSSSGLVEWDLTLGGDSTDIMKNIAIGMGGLLVGGYSISDTSGTKSENGYGGYDFWLNKVDPFGNLLGDKTMGGSQNDFLEEIRPKIHSAGYWVSGTTYSGSGGTKTSNYFNNGDMWVLKMDTALRIEFDRTIGSYNSERCKDMEISPEGSAILAGWSNGSGGNKTSTTKGMQDYWIYKLDTLGNIYWDRSYGGTQGDSLEAIFIKCDRGILAGGYSESSISGNRTHLNKGGSDYWAFELSVPTHPWFHVQNVCARTPLNFYDQSDVWPDSWKWDFDDPYSANNTSESQHVIHTYTQPGTYNVSLTVKEGCQEDTTLVRQVTVYENTVLGNIDLGRDRSVCGNELEIMNVHPDAPSRVTYSWSTGDSTESIYVEDKGLYQLTISDANCSANDTVLVDTCPDFGIPLAFSPNGDELNDIFQVYGVGLHEFEMLIFNRWGQVIFKSNNQNEGWDGTKNGKPCQIDVYVYKIIYRGLGLSQKQKVGQVALIR